MAFIQGKKHQILIGLLSLWLPILVLAHGMDHDTRQFLNTNASIAIAPFMYIGAKHMVTGYDHLLFLIGVIFFVYRPKDILLYVSVFTLGHSITLLLGVLYQITVNPHLIDAIIGFSIIYKGFDNLGGFKQLMGFQPDTRWAVLIFGLFHGFGLATKLQEFYLPQTGVWENLLAFNVGVEIGQVLALTFILLIFSIWRQHASYLQFATTTNTVLMSSGMIIVGYQLAAYGLLTLG